MLACFRDILTPVCHVTISLHRSLDAKKAAREEKKKHLLETKRRR